LLFACYLTRGETVCSRIGEYKIIQGSVETKRGLWMALITLPLLVLIMIPSGTGKSIQPKSIAFLPTDPGTTAAYSL
jgi:hypothetical protein